jgi:hypothetical protein
MNLLYRDDKERKLQELRFEKAQKEQLIKQDVR